MLENHLSLLVETVFVDIDSHSLFSMQIPFNAVTSTVHNKVSLYWNHLHIFFRSVVYLKWSLSGLDLIAYLLFHSKKK